MRNMAVRLMVLLLVLLSAPAVLAQEGISRKQQEKNLAKKEREDRKAKARKEKEDRKRHLSIQDKETRKRIKRHTRRADRSGTRTHRDGRGLFHRRR